MRLSSFVVVAALSTCAVFTGGCRRDRAESPGEWIAMLQSPDADERRKAADELMDDGGPGPEAVPYLIAALQREQDPKAYGMMLLALGKSGAPEALPYLDANMNNPNKHVRERAEKGMAAWSRRNPNGIAAPPPGYPPPPGAYPPPAGTPPAAPPGKAPAQPPAEEPGQSI
jgi:hypothetical protein